MYAPPAKQSPTAPAGPPDIRPRSAQVSKIFVTGHSMGGSLAMMFACIIKGWSERICALPEGKSLAIVGRVMTRLADDKVEVMLTDARTVWSCR
jgi:hypothetical protein